MNYVLDAVLIIVGLVFLIGGVRRGPLAEGLALASIVLGALLMVEWGDVWGTDLAETVPLGPAGVTRFIVWLVLLLAPVVIIGWGGSLLLPRLQPNSPVVLLATPVLREQAGHVGCVRP